MAAGKATFVASTIVVSERRWQVTGSKILPCLKAEQKEKVALRTCSLKDLLYKKRMERQLAAARGEYHAEKPPEEASPHIQLTMTIT